MLLFNTLKNLLLFIHSFLLHLRLVIFFIPPIIGLRQIVITFILFKWMYSKTLYWINAKLYGIILLKTRFRPINYKADYTIDIKLRYNIINKKAKFVHFMDRFGFFIYLEKRHLNSLFRCRSPPYQSF